MAEHIPVGEPAHQAERDAIRYLIEALPAAYRVYSNAWVLDRDGAAFEVDAVVVAPHAFFCVECKAYRGRVAGNDHDWLVGDRPERNVLGRNRLAAQVLNSALRRRSAEAGRPWVEGVVFLSHPQVEPALTGPACRHRVHTRRNIVNALTNPAVLERRAHRSLQPVTDHVRRVLDELLRGVDVERLPSRQVHAYRLGEVVARTDATTDYEAEHGLTGERRILRLFQVSTVADADTRRSLTERCRWEASVLALLGQHPYTQGAGDPFEDDFGIWLPLERFDGITLPSWLERFPAARLGERLGVLRKAVDALTAAHAQGVVHRQLRPESVLVAAVAEQPDVRLVGFDMAKRADTSATMASGFFGAGTSPYLAPEVARCPSDAEPAADQFGLGVVLYVLLTGRRPFACTPEHVRHGRLSAPPSSLEPQLPRSFDAVVERMLAVRPAERFSSLDEALQAVDEAAAGRTPAVAPAGRGGPADRPPPDPDHLSPGTHVGADYEVRAVLGRGGLATVYAARHLPSGETRALKVARSEERAEAALRDEYQALRGLDHPAIVTALDLSNVVPDRVTLVLERVSEQTLGQRLAEEPAPEPSTLRRWVEDLLAALGYLEERGVVHKDLKPENLLVSQDGLLVIDFSLAGHPAEAVLAGTSLYRDPALVRWTPAADRYAAALCLFEVFAGHHAFAGRAPEPGVLPPIDVDSFDDAYGEALRDFFVRALHPDPSRRFPSAAALRSSLLEALGDRPPSTRELRALSALPGVRGDTPVRSLRRLPRRAIRALTRTGIETAAELVRLSPQRIRSLHAVGRKTARDILEVRDLLAAALPEVAEDATPRPAAQAEPALRPDLVGDEGELAGLGLTEGAVEALARAGYTTIGDAAGLTRSQVLDLHGIGPAKLADLAARLARHAEAALRLDRSPANLDELWEEAGRQLDARDRTLLELRFGLAAEEPATWQEVADAVGMSRQRAHQLVPQRVCRLDDRVLAAPLEFLASVLEALGGLVSFEEAVQRLQARWPEGRVQGRGFVRLLAETSAAPYRLVKPERAPGPWLAAPEHEGAALAEYARRADALMRAEPPVPAESARRELEEALPHYPHDPVSLALRLCPDARLTGAGELFMPPVAPPEAIRHTVGHCRLPVSLAELRAAVERMFPEAVGLPEEDGTLEGMLGEAGCEVRDGQVVVAGAEVVPRVEPPAERADSDPLDDDIRRLEISEEAAVARHLEYARERRGFRLLVLPPESHHEIARSVAERLGVAYRAFDRLLIERLVAGGWEEAEDAELFEADRVLLTEAARAVLDDLLREFDSPTSALVLGETGLFGRCEVAREAVRRVYDQTHGGQRGFWALCIPGVIHRRQAYFNEVEPVLHMEGQVLPLRRPLTDPEGT